MLRKMYACIAYTGALPSVLILASQDVLYKVLCGQSKQKPLAFNRYPTKDDYRWQVSIWKDVPLLISFREMQTKTAMRSHYTSIRMVKVWTIDTTKCW